MASHKPILSSGEFRLSRPVIPNFIANPAATQALIGKTRALLEEATPDHPHPVALVELSSEKKVVVVELAEFAVRLHSDLKVDAAVVLLIDGVPLHQFDGPEDKQPEALLLEGGKSRTIDKQF